MLSIELKKAADELGLIYNDQSQIMYGNYKGYKTIVSENSIYQSYYFKIPCKVMDEYQMRYLNDFFSELLFSGNVKAANYVNRYILIEILGNTTDDAKNIIAILDKVINFLQINNYQTCCEICGTNTETGLQLINNEKLYICNDCFNRGTNTFNTTATTMGTSQRSGNVLTGTVGALIGSLIGVALWVAVYSLGYIAVVCGIVLAVCTMKGYEILGGKLDLKGLIISCVITLAMVYVSTHLSYGFAIYKEFKGLYDIDIFDAVKSVNNFLREFDDIRREFNKDLVIGYLFTIIGVVSSIFSSGRSKR